MRYCACSCSCYEKIIFIDYIICSLSRIPLDMYEIQRHVVESHRKLRKQVKRDAKSRISRHNNSMDMGITNWWMSKEDLLKHMTRLRE